MSKTRVYDGIICIMYKINIFVRGYKLLRNYSAFLKYFFTNAIGFKNEIIFFFAHEWLYFFVTIIFRFHIAALRIYKSIKL